GAAFLMWVVVPVARRETADTEGSHPPRGATLGHLDPTPPAPLCEGGERVARAPVVTATIAVVACTLAAVGWELSWQMPPRLVQEARSRAVRPDLQKRLVVIGDSLSAEDFTEGGDPWPKLLAREHGIEIVNLAFSGAKAGSAAKRVTSEELANTVVLLEI